MLLIEFYKYFAPLQISKICARMERPNKCGFLSRCTVVQLTSHLNIEVNIQFSAILPWLLWLVSYWSPIYFPLLIFLRRLKSRFCFSFLEAVIWIKVNYEFTASYTSVKLAGQLDNWTKENYFKIGGNDWIL